MERLLESKDMDYMQPAAKIRPTRSTVDREDEELELFRKISGTTRIGKSKKDLINGSVASKEMKESINHDFLSEDDSKRDAYDWLFAPSSPGSPPFFVSETRKPNANWHSNMEKNSSIPKVSNIKSTVVVHSLSDPMRKKEKTGLTAGQTLSAFSGPLQSYATKSLSSIRSGSGGGIPNWSLGTITPSSPARSVTSHISRISGSSTPTAKRESRAAAKSSTPSKQRSSSTPSTVRTSIPSSRPSTPNNRDAATLSKRASASPRRDSLSSKASSSPRSDSSNTAAGRAYSPGGRASRISGAVRTSTPTRSSAVSALTKNTTGKPSRPKQPSPRKPSSTTSSKYLNGYVPAAGPFSSSTNKDSPMFSSVNYSGLTSPRTQPKQSSKFLDEVPANLRTPRSPSAQQAVTSITRQASTKLQRERRPSPVLPRPPAAEAFANRKSSIPSVHTNSCLEIPEDKPSNIPALALSSSSMPETPSNETIAPSNSAIAVSQAEISWLEIPPTVSALASTTSMAEAQTDQVIVSSISSISVPQPEIPETVPDSSSSTILEEQMDQKIAPLNTAIPVPQPQTLSEILKMSPSNSTFTDGLLSDIPSVQASNPESQLKPTQTVSEFSKVNTNSESFKEMPSRIVVVVVPSAPPSSPMPIFESDASSKLKVSKIPSALPDPLPNSPSKLPQELGTLCGFPNQGPPSSKLSGVIPSAIPSTHPSNSPMLLQCPVNLRISVTSAIPSINARVRSPKAQRPHIVPGFPDETPPSLSTSIHDRPSSMITRIRSATSIAMPDEAPKNLKTFFEPSPSANRTGTPRSSRPPTPKEPPRSPDILITRAKAQPPPLRSPSPRTRKSVDNGITESTTPGHNKLTRQTHDDAILPKNNSASSSFFKHFGLGSIKHSQSVDLSCYSNKALKHMNMERNSTDRLGSGSITQSYVEKFRSFLGSNGKHKDDVDPISSIKGQQPSTLLEGDESTKWLHDPDCPTMILQ